MNISGCSQEQVILVIDDLSWSIFEISILKKTFEYAAKKSLDDDEARGLVGQISYVRTYT